jgi:hypothetical protein
MPGWMWLIMGLLFAVALFVFLWGVGTIRVGRERGGTVDLSAAAARGELDLDWSDTRGDWRLRVGDEVGRITSVRRNQ